VDNDSFEAEQRHREHFHRLRVDDGAWVVLRLDGRGFAKFTRDRYNKPFDLALSELMRSVAIELIQEFGAVLAYTESDEISVLLPPRWDMFDRRVEKAVSISASIAAARFTLDAGETAHFDSRIWVGDNIEGVAGYFSWRQTDAARCALNGWCYWTLLHHGANERQATRRLHGARSEEKIALLAEHSVEFGAVPMWQRRGVLAFSKKVDHVGHNPITGLDVHTTRQRVVVDDELSAGADFRAMIARLCFEAADAR
jgi:tRNA(His) guanylyltransferase